jgi:subtilisin family serine protease
VLAPASYDNTIAVSATAVDDTLAYYSTTGQEVSFAAPGGSFYDDSNGDGIPEGAVLSLGPENGTDGQLDTVDGKVAGFELDESLQSGDGYWYRQGTSMATPHVAGVVGLLYSYAPNLNQDAVYAILANTAKDLGDPGHDEEFGHGLIDAEAALEYLINAGRDYPVQPRTLGGGGGSGDGISRAAVSSLAADGAGRNRGKRPSQRRGAILPEAGAELDATSIIVKLTERAEARRGVAAARSLAAGVDAAGAARIGGRLYRIDLRSGHGVEAAIRALGTHEDVEYVQPNYRYRLIE